jgi:monothiol glutaredoxin
MSFLPIQTLPPTELSLRLSDGEAFTLIDVRTPAERAICHIDGSKLLDAEQRAALGSLPKDSPIVFVCHKGVRSMATAVRYAAMGYTNLYNLTGGVEAWARDVDPEMARYLG